MVTRRGFLGALSIAIAAPAIVRASSLMKLPPPKKIILPEYPEVLRFGNMVWRPELVMVLPVARGGTSATPMVSAHRNLNDLKAHLKALPLMTNIQIDTGLISTSRPRSALYPGVTPEQKEFVLSDLDWMNDYFQ